MKSRVNRELHARFCEGLGVKISGLIDRKQIGIKAVTSSGCAYFDGVGNG